MRTITITKDIYSFNELSEDAKESAIEYFRNDSNILAWQRENAETVETIAKRMNWRYSYESYDGIRYTVYFEIGDCDIEELAGSRAMAYIYNNYINAASEAKIYWLHNVLYADGRKNWNRKSKINFTIDNCPFTGYCMDCCFAEAWREWLKQFNKNSTVAEFVELVADRLSEEWTNDNEYQISDDGIIELIQANEYEFTVDGSLY